MSGGEVSSHRSEEYQDGAEDDPDHPDFSHTWRRFFRETAFADADPEPEETLTTPRAIERTRRGIIASRRFQVTPAKVTGSSQPICSPRSPKNSPKRNPKTMVGIAEMMKMVARLRSHSLSA